MTIKRKYFDKEYQTTFLREVKHLEDNFIYPCYIKKIEDTIIYKFTKDNELFLCLSKYYSK